MNRSGRAARMTWSAKGAEMLCMAPMQAAASLRGPARAGHPLGGPTGFYDPGQLRPIAQAIRLVLRHGQDAVGPILVDVSRPVLPTP